MVVDPCLPFKGTQNGNGYNKRKVAEPYLQGCYRDFAAQLPLERNTLHVTSRMGLAGRLV